MLHLIGDPQNKLGNHEQEKIIFRKQMNPAVYIVLLESNEHRKQHVEQNVLPKLKNFLEVNVIPAVEGQTNDLKLTTRRIGLNLSEEYAEKAISGHLACTLSHYSIWSQFYLNSSATHAIILEDDAVVSSQFQAQVDQALQKVNGIDGEYWDFTYLYTPDEQTPAQWKKYAGGLVAVPAFYQWCTVGYILTRPGAKRLLELFTKITTNVDTQIATCIRDTPGKLKAYTVFPSPVQTCGQVGSKTQRGLLKSNTWGTPKVAGQQTAGQSPLPNTELITLQRNPKSSTKMTDLERNVTIIVKTFQRPVCFEAFMKSLRQFYPHIHVIAVDDSHIHPTIDPYQLTYVVTDFDIGVSTGRNMALDLVKTKYFVVVDDDDIVTKDTQLEKWFKLLNENDDIDMVGGKAASAPYHGTWSRPVIPGDVLELHVGKAHAQRSKNGHKLYDITHQFFMGRTKKIQPVRWDDELKTADHSVFFYRCKRAGLTVAFDPTVTIDHKHLHSEAYDKFRVRKSFHEIAVQKLNAREYVVIR